MLFKLPIMYLSYALKFYHPHYARLKINNYIHFKAVESTELHD